MTEAKEPQTILNFEQAGAHSLAPELTVNSTADLDRLAPRAPVNIILLDEFNTRFEDMAFARYSLKKFLEKQPEKLSTPTMLIAVGLQKFTVLHDYTQDKMAVLDALDHHFVSNPWQLQQGTWIPDRFATAFGTLMRVAEATVGHPGHKNMIWIGRGFPALRFTNLQVDAEARVNNAVQECVNMLRDARVTLYAIDPAGVLADPAVYGFGAALDDPFGGNYQFNRMATATGGRALYGRNDVDAEIGTSIRDGSSFYTLTYRPSNTSLDPQKFRRIRVTLDRPGLTATTREGYYLQHGPGRVDPQNPSRRLAFDLVSAGDSTMAYDGVPSNTGNLANRPGGVYDPYRFACTLLEHGDRNRAAARRRDPDDHDLRQERQGADARREKHPVKAARDGTSHGKAGASARDPDKGGARSQGGACTLRRARHSFGTHRNGGRGLGRSAARKQRRPSRVAAVLITSRQVPRRSPLGKAELGCASWHAKPCNSRAVDESNSLLRIPGGCMSTQQASAEYKAKAQEMLGEKFSVITGDMERVRSSGTVDAALKVGQAAPDFTLPDASAKQVSLRTLLASGPVVISFYRGEWCPFCNIELRGLEESAAPDAGARRHPHRNLSREAGLRPPCHREEQADLSGAERLRQQGSAAVRHCLPDRSGVARVLEKFLRERSRVA